MKNIKFMALISPLILCGCSTPATPTATTFAVALQSGEGTFSDGKTCIVLNNVVEGTTLNQIEGYKLPEEEDCIFSNWLDEQGNIVSSTITVTSNLVLTATYETDPEVIRKELSKRIEEEGQKAIDYAINKQIAFGYIDFLIGGESEVEGKVLPTAMMVINDSKNVTSPTQMQMIYKLTHLCLETMNKIDVVDGRFNGVVPNEAYYNIAWAYLDSIENYANKKLTVDQLSAIHDLSCAKLLSYWRSDSAYFMDEIYDKYVAKATQTTSALELREIDKIGCGLIRGCSRQNDKFGYTPAEEMVNEKLTEAKKIFTQDDLTTIIDCLGNAASIYCKYGYEMYDTAFENMYIEVLILLKNEIKDPHASNKLEMLLAFIDAGGYYIDSDAIRPEYNLYNYLSNIIDADKEGKYVNGITEIAVHGANALKQYNEHCTKYENFIEAIKTVVGTYTSDNGEEFLDCAIYTMDMGAQLNLVSEDLYFKEYMPTDSRMQVYMDSFYIDYSKITMPLQKAINLFESRIEMEIPENKMEAFKIIIKGIIATSKFGTPNNMGTAIDDFISAFTTYGLSKMLGMSVAGAIGFAYACTGLNCAYSYINTFTAERPDTYSYFTITIQDQLDKIFTSWADIFSRVPLLNIHLTTFIGKALALSWQKDYSLIVRAYSALNNDEGVDKGFNYATRWMSYIKNCLLFFNPLETLYAIESVFASTFNSGRYYYYYCDYSHSSKEPPDFWYKYTEFSEEKMQKFLDTLLGKIYSSTTIKQFVGRANIYVTNFIETINRQNSEQSFIDIPFDNLYEATLKAMDEEPA
ncbi:MAG: hypothetical protein MJ214_03965 [Bacilli bacterium]|nr:hypothetical protein [Bacilli bacterium]